MFALILEGICPHHRPGIYPDAGKERTSPGTETLKWKGQLVQPGPPLPILLPAGPGYLFGAGGWETPFGWAIYHDPQVPPGAQVNSGRQLCWLANVS